MPVEGDSVAVDPQDSDGQALTKSLSLCRFVIDPGCCRPDLVDQGHGHWAKDVGGLNCDWTEDEPVVHSNVLGDFPLLG